MLRVCGQGRVSSTTFLIDYGAIILVITQDLMDGKVHIVNHQSAVKAVEANGLPIDIVVQVDVLVSFKGVFFTMYPFLVVMELSVECFLGSNFLMKNAAIIDYTEQSLLLGKGNKNKIPLGESRCKGTKAMTNVIVSQNVAIALCTVQNQDSTLQALQLGLI